MSIVVLLFLGDANHSGQLYKGIWNVKEIGQRSKVGLDRRCTQTACSAVCLFGCSAWTCLSVIHAELNIMYAATVWHVHSSDGLCHRFGKY